MEKKLHSVFAKWLAGLLMMVFLSAGIYFGVQVLAAVDCGGMEVLGSNVPDRYEDSKNCVEVLAQVVKHDISLHIISQIYEKQCKDMTGVAMTVWPCELWEEAITAETESGDVNGADMQSLNAVGTEMAENQNDDMGTGIQEYTYDALMELREAREIYDTDDTVDDFFEDVEKDIYIEVSRQQLIQAIKENADAKEVFDMDETWETKTENIDNNEITAAEQNIYYMYNAEVNGSEWTYYEGIDTIECSRFGQLDSQEPFYYSKSALDQYVKGYVSDRTSGDISAALLAAPICYFDVLVQHYTKELNHLQDSRDALQSSLDALVNYRYRVELLDGTIWTNASDMADLKEDASLYWNYDYVSGDITGTLSSSCAEYLYSRLLGGYEIYYDLPSGEEELDIVTYGDENVKSISIALSEGMEYNDMVKSYKTTYEKYAYLYKDARQNLRMGIICLLAFLVLFVYLLLVLGYQDHNGTLTRPPVTFRFYTELMLAVVFGFPLIFFVLLNVKYNDDLIQGLGGEINYVCVLCIGMCWLVLPVCFELLTRIRHRQFFAKSLCYRLLHAFVAKPLAWCKRKLKALKQLWVNVCSAMRIDARLCISFLASQILLFVLVMVGALYAYDYDGVGIFILLLAFIFEVGVIAVVFRDIRYTAQIIQGVEELKKGNLDYQIPTEHMRGHKRELAENINHLQSGLKLAVEQSIKDERLKTELITNVSHDIKTPLTSIINYVDLLKQEPVEGENAKHYLEVLDQKSQRLKQLMEDLVELSKSATGNVEFTPMRLDLIELLRQTLGEFEDKFNSRNLTVIENFKLQSAVVNLDSKYTFRVFENLCQNIYKYAMENSRVYVDVSKEDMSVQIVMKNISQFALNISADDLMERFVRGDASRNTSGSGLGLSIAKNLVTLQQGAFYITLDGDLFKVTVTFPLAEEVQAVAVIDEIKNHNYK